MSNSTYCPRDCANYKCRRNKNHTEDWKCNYSYYGSFEYCEAFIKERQGMMIDKCTECENKTMLEFADIAIKYDRALKHIEILNECMDTKEMLNEFYRQENEELKNKIRILENDR